MKALKTALKVVGVLVGLIAVLVLAIIGARAYNGHKYPIVNSMSDSRDKAQYPTDDHIVSIEGEHLNGFHFIPEQRLHPGTVIVYGGSEGSPAYWQAKTIADQGYEVLALYFWGQPNQVPALSQIPLEQFDEVVNWVETTIEQPRPITVIGSSKGAEYTALLAAHGYPVDNLVNYTPGDHSYPGLSPKNNQELPSFTNRGESVPYASLRKADGSRIGKMLWDMIIGRPPQYRPVYQQAAERADDSSRIDLSDFRGHALFFAGDKDAMWQGDIAAQNLSAQNERFEAFIYPDAGHVFLESEDQLPSGWEIMLGGTADACVAAYHASNEVLFSKLSEWHGTL